MIIQYECFGCIFKMLLELSRTAGRDDANRHRIMQEFLRHLAADADRISPPELASELCKIFVRETGITDSYEEIKDKSTALGQSLLPELRKIAAESADPFGTAVRLAIGGNVIDYGVNPDFKLEDAERLIREVLQLPLDSDALALLRARFDAAHSILYILDNCGEAVIDRLLLERCAGRVTIAVRGGAILNDVTRRELADSGLAEFPVVDTGSAAPGVLLKKASPEFLAALNSCDLVIAKGQGNYESLGDELDRPVFYLLRTKCPVIAKRLNSPQGGLKILPRNL